MNPMQLIVGEPLEQNVHKKVQVVHMTSSFLIITLVKYRPLTGQGKSFIKISVLIVENMAPDIVFFHTNGFKVYRMSYEQLSDIFPMTFRVVAG